MIERNGLGIELRGLGKSEQLAHFRMDGNGDLHLRVTGWPVFGRLSTIVIELDAEQADALETYLTDMRLLREAPKHRSKR
jgi:hypothetical protein